jgi:hypothetical protein
MTRPILLAALLALPLPALAQDEAAATAVAQAMVAEVSPSAETAALLASCIVATATPEERAQLAAAPGASTALAPLVNGIMERPATIACIQANS